MTPTQAQIDAAKAWTVWVPIHPKLGPYWPSMNIGEKRPKENFIDGYIWTRCALTAAAESEPQTSAEYHQRRGAAWDIIDQAICSYDSFILDDDYDAQGALDKIIAKMRERRALYHSDKP